MANGKPSFARQAVGTIGRRRIVPVVGVNYIAGQLAFKNKPYKSNKTASIGGRTRYWSSINFLSIATGLGRTTDFTAEELNRIEMFTKAAQYTALVMHNVTSLQAIQTDISNDTPREGKYRTDFISIGNWVTSVAYNAQANGKTLPTTPTWPIP